jgi:hypothetical protein
MFTAFGLVKRLYRLQASLPWLTLQWGRLQTLLLFDHVAIRSATHSTAWPWMRPVWLHTLMLLGYYTIGSITDRAAFGL